MSSGVGLNDACLKAYQELKSRKAKYVLYKLSDDLKEIVVDKTSTSTDYEDFVGDLPENDCRWAVYDLEYDTDDGKRNKIFFYSWSPDTAKIKSKMLYASSREVLRRSLQGIAKEIQGTDSSEVTYEAALEKALKK